ncbi:MAG TPA: hypothetical protein VKG20_00880 [Methylomirabilota bacterium]|nr:hypothetical protein [Methylomirabilota bacterium]
MPVGGHTAVALAWTNASDSPIFPATKYTPVSATSQHPIDISSGHAMRRGGPRLTGDSARRLTTVAITPKVLRGSIFPLSPCVSIVWSLNAANNPGTEQGKS